MDSFSFCISSSYKFLSLQHFRYSGYPQDVYAMVSILFFHLNSWLILTCLQIHMQTDIIKGAFDSKSVLLMMQNYYNVYGGQQFSPYYTNAASGSPGVYYNYYPFYAQYGQSGSTQGFGIQFAQTSQYPYLPQQYRGVGILSLPTSPSPANSATGWMSNQCFLKFTSY